MKLKQDPGDFIVEEIAAHALKPDGAYLLFLLEKRGMETFALLRSLSAQNNVPLREFGIAGLKDKHAVTRQYFTIPARYAFRTLHGRGFSITRQGYVDAPIHKGDLLGNRFLVTIRDIRQSELTALPARAAAVQRDGVPNYFDSQRFGSVIGGQFIAKHILNKGYEQAAKVYLTACAPSEPRRVKEEKRRILKSWHALAAISVRERQLAAVLRAYQKTASWEQAYLLIPAELRRMYMEAYRSYIWNECVKALLRRAVRDLFSVKYRLGDLLFYRHVKGKEMAQLPPAFPLAGRKGEYAPQEERIIKSVLEQEGVQRSALPARGGSRTTILQPKGLVLHAPEPDELNRKRWKVSLSCELPKGGYMTVVIKRLFAG